MCGRGSLAMARRSGRGGYVMGGGQLSFCGAPRGVCKAPLVVVVRQKWKQFMSSSAVGWRWGSYSWVMLFIKGPQQTHKKEVGLSGV